MKSMTLIMLVSLLLGNISQAIAQDKAPKSLKVRRASQSFQNNQARAKAILDKKIAEAQKEYLAELKELGQDYKSVLEEEQEDVTKNGELEEALKIKQMVEEFDRSLKREQITMSSSASSNSLTLLESKLEGTHWKFSGGQKLYFEKNGEGGFLGDQRKFQWGAISNDQVLVRYLKTNYVDIFHFELDKKMCTVRGVGFVGQVTKTGTPIPYQ